MQSSMLLLDDEPNLCRSLGRALQRDDLRVDTFTDPAQAVDATGRNTYALALIDLLMPGMGGLDVLREIKRLSPETLVVIMTAYATVPTAVEAMRSGAFDYLQKPFTNDEARHHVERALRHFHLEQENRDLRSQLADRYGMSNIVASSKAMGEVLRVVERVANSSATVLLKIGRAHV